MVFIGMTVNDVGEGHFDTEITRFTIVDHLVRDQLKIIAFC